ncbi:probable methyltransferase At1g27930 [Lotus japonicus]|uniref:probable methyltransferase At1g27930 n=1 Tax=Lotus japonicus TaxID=34305 RepID=UPI00258D37EC|nr:probable methyltransferase At1g27930 [Lotus japonicus]
MQPLIVKTSHQPSHKKKHPPTSNPCLLYVFTASAATTVILLLYFRRIMLDPATSCPAPKPLTAAQATIAAEFDTAATTLVAIFHYATTRDLPQQSKAEIRRPFDVLQSLAPCNFLVFGLGHDSLMWDSFNPRGTTLFLEEDPGWTVSTLQRFPVLRTHTVRYPTRLSEAKSLMASYKEECGGNQPLKGNQRCRLALSELPEEVYERDWDVIMIDAPRGYFAAAPGRMGVIFSAAVMARGRKKSGVTHVFLHDCDREVEKLYAKEFLCMKYRVVGLKRLWHFAIPPAENYSDATHGFC